MIAQGSEEKVMQKIIQEEDALVGDFDESYKHLAFKHILGLLWATKNCPNDGRIIKMDDDIGVDIPKMIIKSLDVENIGGWIHEKMTVRRKASKWSLTKDEYKYDIYPDFVSGWAYAMDMKSAKKIVKLGLEKFNGNLWIDDVWITGKNLL